MAAILKKASGQVWTIAQADAPDTTAAAPSLLDRQLASKAAEEAAVLALPVVKAAFDAFPDAQLISIDERKTA